MRIAIDGNILTTLGSTKPNTAVWVMYFLLKNRDKHTFFVITDRPIEPNLEWLTGISCQVLKPLAGIFRSSKLWYDFQLAGYLANNKIDAFIGFSGVISLKSNIKQVLWLQDMLDLVQNNPKKFTGSGSFGRRLDAMIQKSFKVVVPATSMLPLGFENRVSVAKTVVLPVVPNSDGNIHEAATKKVSENLSPDISALISGGMPYFLCIDGWQTTTEAVELLMAFSAFKKRMETGMKLVLAGNEPREKGFMDKLATFKYRKDVLMLTNTSPENLSLVFSSAYCLLHLPAHPVLGNLLNALHKRVPVISRLYAAYTDLLTDCVLFCTSEPGESLAQQMMLIYKDENHRSALMNKGYALSLTMEPREAAQKLLFLLASND